MAKRKNKVRILAVIAIMIAFAAVGGTLAAKYVNSKNTSASPSETASDKGDDKDTENSQSDSKEGTGKGTKDAVKKDYAPLIAQIQQYTAGKQGMYGVYFKSLVTKQEWGINENEEYIAASTVKVPVNLCLYDSLAKGKDSLDMKMVYQKGDYETGTGSIQYKKIGTEYSLKDLSKLSIEVSDNVAVNMLIRYLGREQIYSYEESIVKHPVTRGKNVSNPKDMAMYMQAALDLKDKHPELGEDMLNYLKNTIFNDRLPKYLPKNVEIAHKIGTQVRAFHDVGIVFAEKPYIVTVMSKNINEKEADEVIAQISKMIYDFESK